MSRHAIFRYPDELGYELPMLILAIRASSSDDADSYPLKERWRAQFRLEQLVPLRHQTAGHACHHHNVWALPLRPLPETAVAMLHLEKQWYGSNAGVFGVRLDEVLTYRQQLQAWLNVDCNWSYRDFEEGIYPIDAQSAHLRTLTAQEWPDDLDDLLAWSRPDDPPDERERRAAMRRLFGFINRWTIFILTENSD